MESYPPEIVDVAFRFRYCMLDPLSSVLGLKLLNVTYHDVLELKDLDDSFNGDAHVVAVQIELEYENSTKLFLSWGNPPGWYTYSLVAQKLSFGSDSLRAYKANHFPNWKTIIGESLTSFKIWGHETYEVKSHLEGSDEMTVVTCYKQPHLVELFFGKLAVTILNAYFLKDKYPEMLIGDDVGVFFNPLTVDKIKKHFNLEVLSENIN